MSFLKLYFIIAIIQGSEAVPGIKKIYNLMLVKEATDVNIEHFWEDGVYNDYYGNKSLLPLSSSIQDGNFRSALIDDWIPELEPPDEVAILVLNMTGDLHSWLVFNTSDVTNHSLPAWLTAERLVDNSFNITSEVKITWMQLGYQLSVTTQSEPKLSWLAVSDRNFNNGNTQRPYFLIPSNTSAPFPYLPDSLDIILKWTIRKDFEIDLEDLYGPQPTLIDHIMVGQFSDVVILGTHYPIPNMTLEYSTESCSIQNKTVYTDPLSNFAKVFETNIVNRIDHLLIRCLWIHFSRNILYPKKVTLYQPTLDNENFVDLPIVAFKGFWYKEALPHGSSQAINYFHKTQDELFETVRPTSTQNMTTSVSTQDISTASYVDTSRHSVIWTDNERSDTMTSELTSYTSSPAVDLTTQQSDKTTPSIPSVYCSTNADVQTPKLENCMCSCADIGDGVFDLERRLEELHDALAVDKHLLSSYKRLHQSADDQRPSAVYIGFFGALIMSFCIIVIVLLDLFSCIQYLNAKRRYKQKDN